MRRTLATFILLLILFSSSLFLTRFAKDVTLSKPLLNANTFLSEYENVYRPEILKYRIGEPRFEYNNPNAPYSNSYPLHPKPFIPGYRQPIDGIVPSDYKTTLGGPNVMSGSFKEGCKDNCIDTQPDYYSDLLNL
jgi:hypothetical protein